ncbi:hypothetical protein CBP51_16975 [Cellvibrio mixtus]|uniref:Uncharacterized protein n=1 Tax=Cellvibrio mixtus TaxID=39650 RepID=A0A266Q4P7_9GAMM|nr:DUF2786 domain-containing protein [Cellvibrio mixtus]OZY84854.1 hypothetical protein CBP51_16975 [Cellvibrio mixtus]
MGVDEMADDKILDKIKKCLALAKSSNANEAQTALRQARKLMELHNIEFADVQASVVTESSRLISAKPPTWAWKLAHVSAGAFGCEFIGVETWKGVQFRFIGIDSYPELSSYAFDVLSRQLKKARTEYVGSLTRCKLSTKRRRGDEFADAWVNSVYRLIADFAGADEEVVMQIEAYKTKTYPDLTTTPMKPRKRNARDVDARYAGHRAAKSASLHKAMGADQRTAIEHRG